MSYMFEVFYRSPADAEREARLTEQVEQLGGWFSFREVGGNEAGSVCLTFEFDDLEAAEQAAETLRERGEYVEGPVHYAS